MVTSQKSIGVAAVDESTKADSGPRARVKYVVEAIGTLFLVFTVGAAVGSHSPLAPWPSAPS
jgi:aquaporin Z